MTQATQTTPLKSDVPNVTMSALPECKVSWGLLPGYGVCYWPLLGALGLDVCVYSLAGIRFIIAPGAGILWVKSMPKLVDILHSLFFQKFNSRNDTKS
jgi:hypothetical protein